MQRKVLVMAALVALGGLGAMAAAGASLGCDLGEVPEPVPVLTLQARRFTLLAPAEPAPLAPDLGLAAQDTHPCEGKLRPGVRAVFDNSWLCTLNWVYTDNNGALYIGTAGHCLPNMAPRRISAAGIADIGDPAFTTGNSGVGNDFALIRIDPAYYPLVDPTLCHWGGPNRVHAGGPQALVHYGHGSTWGQTSVTRARAGVVTNTGWSGGHFEFEGIVAPGDSGSPIMTSDGGAAGVITHTWNTLPPHAGFQYANRVDSGLGAANNAQPGMGYRLVPSTVPVDLTGVSVPT